jgi:hypothetical protein
MSKGFCYFPEGRLTATQLLKDASFKAAWRSTVVRVKYVYPSILPLPGGGAFSYDNNLYLYDILFAEYSWAL